MPPEEALSDVIWRSVARDYLDAMGFEKSQFILVRHTDTESHQHVHIVANRVGMAGKTVSDSFDHYRAQSVVRAIEESYHLRPVLPSWKSSRKALSLRQLKQEAETGIPSVQRLLQDGITEALQESLSLPDLVKRLEQRNIQTYAFYGQQNQLKGLAYEMNGVVMSGTSLGYSYQIGGLMQQLEQQSPGAGAIALHSPEQIVRSRKAVIATIQAAAFDQPRLPELLDRLQDEGIETHVQFTHIGRYGKRAKRIQYRVGNIGFQASDLGKDYTLQGLQSIGVLYDPAIDDAAIQQQQRTANVMRVTIHGTVMDESLRDRSLESLTQLLRQLTDEAKEKNCPHLEVFSTLEPPSLRLSVPLDADRERFILYGESPSKREPIIAEALPRTDGTAVSLDDEPRFSRRRTGLFETNSPPNLSSPTDSNTRSGGLEVRMGHDDRSLHRSVLQPQRDSSRSLPSNPDRHPTSRLPDPVGQSQRNDFERLVKPSITEHVMTDFDLEPKQVAYLPRSLAKAIGTLIPVNMADAAQQALDSFESRNGNIDDYLVKKLGYTDRPNLYQHFSAEQVDGAALAIASIESGKGFVVGDQTGIGKGRICAAVMRYAKEEGLEAIFISQNPSLYADIVRDLQDIGMTDFNPWMTDAGKSIPLPNGTTLRTGNLEQQKDVMQGMMAAGVTGRDAIFTTYSQVQTVSGGVEPLRRAFLRAIAPNAILVLDEAHEAGGGVKNDWKGKNYVPDRAEFIRELVDASKGAFFSSATAIKRPDAIALSCSDSIIKPIPNSVLIEK